MKGELLHGKVFFKDKTKMKVFLKPDKKWRKEYEGDVALRIVEKLSEEI